MHFVNLLRPSDIPSLSLSWSKHFCIRNGTRSCADITLTSTGPKLSFFALGIFESLGMSSWLPSHCCMLLLRAGTGPSPELEQHPFYTPAAMASPAFYRPKFPWYLLSVSWDRQHTVELLRVHSESTSLSHKLKLQSVSPTTQMACAAASLKNCLLMSLH